MNNIENHETDFLFKSIDRKGEILKNKSAPEVVYSYGEKIDFKRDGERKL
ncbi:MAG: hypothetical protein K8S14_09505 [Actinomycetia bacterium]|nr:hypothetical protein [Actinomycetes bacterium]